jgi:hypothetical protein
VATAGLSYSGNWVAPDGSLVVTSQTPIALQAADPGAGLAEIRYVIDCGDWTVYTGPIYLTGSDGPRKIRYYGIDRLGNAEDVKTVSFILDNHTPVTVLEIGAPTYVDERGTWVTSKTSISLRRTEESAYGRTVTYFRVDGRDWQVYSGPFVLYGADGPHQISYYSRNASGVAEDLKTVVVRKDDASPSTRGGSSAPVTQVVVGTPSAGTESVVSPPEESPPVQPAEPELVEAPALPEEPAEEQTPSGASVVEVPVVTELTVQSPSETVNGLPANGGTIESPAGVEPGVQTPSNGTG